MNRKHAIIGLLALLGLLTVFIIVDSNAKRRLAQRSQGQLVVAADGTIAVPRNDNMSIVVDGQRAKATTNGSSATASPDRK